MKMTLFAIFFAVLAACAYAGEYHHEKPIPYKFEYGVHDPHTHDVKSQWEHSDGHHVKGSYTVKEADGTTRIVEYSADPHSGFNAVVKRIGHANHPEHYEHKPQHYGGHGGDSYVGTTKWGGSGHHY